MSNVDKLQLTDFDCLTCGSYLQILKAYIPFVPANMQSSLAVFIRMIELIWTMDFYKKGPPLTMQKQTTDLKDILKEIRPCCPGKDLEILETFSNLGNINEIMNLYNTVSNADNAAENPITSALLSPKQKELYEKYKKSLNI